MAGYIKLFRRLIDWEWYQDTNTKCVFLHLLLMAQHEEKRWMGRPIQRGQVVTSHARLASELGMSLQNIRTALNNLQRSGEIVKNSTNKYTIITICKWDAYQCPTNEDQQTNNKPITNQQQTNNNQPTNQQQTTNNIQECKEYKEREEDDPHTYAHACVRVRENDERFYAEMKRGGTQWQEDACRTLKITLPELADLVCQFEVECRAKGTTHISWKDASSHFIDWGRRQVQSRQKQQNYGRKNKQDNPRGEFEPTPNADYSAPI